MMAKAASRIGAFTSLMAGTTAMSRMTLAVNDSVRSKNPYSSVNARRAEGW